MPRVVPVLATVAAAVAVGGGAAAPVAPVASIQGTIAFATALGPLPDIVVTNVQGRPQTPVGATAFGESQPTWAPDGSRIAFTSDRSKTWRLYTVDANGKTAPLSPPGSSVDVSPAWSPDGKSVAYASDVKGTSDIWLVTVATRKARDLTPGGADDGEPAWSPAGDRIVFDRVVKRRSDLYTVTPAGVVARLTKVSTPLDEVNPSWAPDGTHVAFDAADAKGNIDIYVLDPKTGEETRLTQLPGLDFQPAWSPDGSQIAFTSDRGGEWDIWVMNADGSGARDLSNNPEAVDTSPAWRPVKTRFAPPARAPAAVRRLLFTCDTGFGGPSANPLDGDGKDNKLCGGSGATTINGKGGNDKIDGKGGKDHLNGNGGDDTIYACAGVSPDADVVDGGDGPDTVYYDKTGKNADTVVSVQLKVPC